MDWIGAIINPTDLNLVIHAHGAGVVAGPFAEGSFVLLFVEHDLAFEADFTPCRDRQAVQFGFDDFERSAAMAAGIRELGNAWADFIAARNVQKRIMPNADQDGAVLAFGEPLFLKLRAMLSG